MSDYWDDMKAAAAINGRLDAIEAKLDELLAEMRTRMRRQEVKLDELLALLRPSGDYINKGWRGPDTQAYLDARKGSWLDEAEAGAQYWPPLPVHDPNGGRR